MPAPSSAADHTTRWGVVSQWKFNNDGLDAVGANNLTNNGTATFGAGKIGQATNLVAASNQYWSHASNAGLATGNFDFGAAAWVNLTDKTTTYLIMGKGDSGGATCEYSLSYLQTSDRFHINMSAGGAAWDTTLDANTFGSPTAGVWYFVMWYWDSVNHLLKIGVNGGAFDSAANSTGGGNGGQPLNIGMFGGSAAPMNGSIDNVLFFKSPPLGIAALANEIRDGLYNSGSGRESLVF